MNQLQPKLIQELSSLRKGRGITPLKLEQKATICMIAARATNVSSDNLTGNQAYNFLLSELSWLTNSRTTVALKNALGINSPHSKLSARRSELATKLAKHSDTVERYENHGINTFAAHLTERYLHMQADDIYPPSSTLYLQELEAQAKALHAIPVSPQ